MLFVLKSYFVLCYICLPWLSKWWRWCDSNIAGWVKLLAARKITLCRRNGTRDGPNDSQRLRCDASTIYRKKSVQPFGRRVLRAPSVGVGYKFIASLTLVERIPKWCILHDGDLGNSTGRYRTAVRITFTAGERAGEK